MNPKEATEYLMTEISQLTAWQAKSNAFIDKLGHENELQKEKYTQLRVAAMMFLEAEKTYIHNISNAEKWKELATSRTRLDAARSVLWDVINDKQIKP